MAKLDTRRFGATGHVNPPLWLCDYRGCPRKTMLEREAAIGRSSWQPVETGWWECRGVHLCPSHNPEEVTT